jgi:hypothetical protein
MNPTRRKPLRRDPALRASSMSSCTLRRVRLSVPERLSGAGKSYGTRCSEEERIAKNLFEFADRCESGGWARKTNSASERALRYRDEVA